MTTRLIEHRKNAMGAIDAHRSIVRANLDKAPSAADAIGAVTGGGGGGGMASMMGGGDQSRQAQAYGNFKHWVYVAVNAIATKIAGQECLAAALQNAPENPQRGMSRSKSTRLTAASRVKSYRMKQRLAEQVKAYGADLEMLPGHPSLTALEQPNTLQGRNEFLYMFAASILLTGEGYIVGGVNKKSPTGIEFWAVPSHWIVPDHEEGLFANYKLKTPGMTEPEPLPPGTVQRAYFPDPSDIKRAYSPLQAIRQATEIDNYIQVSQANLFRRGPNPNVILTIAKQRGPDGKLLDSRPRLTGAARRQITNAVRELWNQTVNQGDPAVIDGLIESVHKLQNTPQEMDWLNSGEAVKKRIFQAYKINPIVVGETTPSNRAQAVEAEKNFCSNAVNPLLNKMSDALTAFIGPLYDKPERLIVWIDECHPIDKAEKAKQWTDALKANAVTVDEFRAEILDLPPDERETTSELMKLVGGVTAAGQLLAQVGQGLISPQQASVMLQTFYAMTPERADLLAGVSGGGGAPAPAAVEPVDNTPDTPQDATGDEGDTNDDGTDEDAEETPVDAQRGTGGRAEKMVLVPPDPGRPRNRAGMDESDLKAVSADVAAKAEKEVVASLADYFRSQVETTADAIEQLPAIAAGSSPEERAERTMQQVWDAEAELEKLNKAAALPLAHAFIMGAEQELLLHSALLEDEAGKAANVVLAREMFADAVKLTTAEEAAERFGVTLPEEFRLSAPDWMIAAAFRALMQVRETEWWNRIPETGRTLISGTLALGVQEGWSTRRIAEAIRVMRGPEYAMHRAMNFARTETGNMLNAGHIEGIRQLERETGMPMGKEWVSVFGTTTRPDHADADGQQVAADGDFTLAGVYQIPWPSHTSLPAEQRCNCQCTVISAVLMESFEPPETQAPKIEEPPEPPATVDDDSADSSLPSLADLEYDDSITLGGSTGARLAKDKKGNRYVIKTGSSPEHLREEYIAEEMYRAMGVGVPESRMDEDGDGRPVKISRFIEGAKPLKSLSGKALNKAKAKMEKEFAAHALLANWDAVGLDYDNIMVDKSGKVWNIDTGGSLRFRAQGAPKGDLFGDHVTELWSLRDRNINPSSAETFKDADWSKIRMGARSALKNRKKVMDRVKELDPSLVDKMEKRFDSLQRIEDKSKRLQKVRFKSTYQDLHCEMDTKFQLTDIRNNFPKKMTPKGQVGHAYDENGELFDGLRARQQNLGIRKFIRANGGDFELIERYQSEQAGSSWSERSKTFKSWMANQLDIDDGDAFYGYNANEGRGYTKAEFDGYYKMKVQTFEEQRKFERTFAAYHAYTQNFLENTTLFGQNKSKRTLSLGRTEGYEVLDQYGIKTGEKTKKLKRGLGESFSQSHTVVVAGNILTYQELPYESIFFHYYNGRNGETMFLSDSENEVIAFTPPDVEVNVIGSTSSGKKLEPPTKWKKKVK